MRWVVGDKAITGFAASASQMGRFQTKWFCRSENLAALADLPGQWIDKVHQQRPPKKIVLDMDSSESPTYGEQEGSAYNGHFACTCYHPLFVFRPPQKSPRSEAARMSVRPSRTRRRRRYAAAVPRPSCTLVMSSLGSGALPLSSVLIGDLAAVGDCPRCLGLIGEPTAVWSRYGL
jgi:hypothetical protein